MATQVTIVLRYDDYTASRGKEDTGKDEIERCLLAMSREQGIPLTLGVVPLLDGRWPLGADAAKLGLLRESVAAGHVEAALHGYTHEPLANVGSRSSEFAGRPPAEQAERVRTGKALVEEWLGAPVESFIPPWNSADEATGQALAGTGISCVSASLLTPRWAATPLVSLPHTCALHQLRRVLRHLAAHDGRAIIVCMFHEFSFKGSTHPFASQHAMLTLAQVSTLLARCREQPGVEFLTLTQAARAYREPLLDGRVDEARELWRLLLSLRRAPVVGRLARELWMPLAIARPGWYARATRRVRRLARWFAPKQGR